MKKKTVIMVIEGEPDWAHIGDAIKQAWQKTEDEATVVLNTSEPIKKPAAVPKKKQYKSDTSDVEWFRLSHLFDHDDAKQRVDRRRVVDAILFKTENRVAWAKLPSSFPSKATVYSLYLQWQKEGLWNLVCKILYIKIRQRLLRIDA